MKNEIPLHHAKDYILGGKAHVVFFNEDTQVQKRFIIYAQYNKQYPTAEEKKDRENIKYWKVFDMDSRPKKFLGKIEIQSFTKEYHFWPEKMKERNEYLTIAANFQHVWKGILYLNLSKNYHILHLGACSMCGRPLTDAVSLARGIGPVCWQQAQPFIKQNSL